MDNITGLCILGIVLVLTIPQIFYVMESNQIDNELVKHIACKDLKQMQNSTHLIERTLVKEEYASRC